MNTLTTKFKHAAKYAKYTVAALLILISITSLLPVPQVLAQTGGPVTLFFSTGSAAATPADTNTGNASAGTLRVVLASDQPAVTVTGTVSVGNGSPVDTEDDAVADGQSGLGLIINLAYGFNTALSNWTRIESDTLAPDEEASGMVVRSAGCGVDSMVTTEYLWTSAQTNDPIVTVSAGTVIYVTQVQVTIDEATTVGVGFRIGFGDTLPTAPTDGNAVAGYLASHRGLVPGSGLSRGDGCGILGIGADGENLSITSEATTSGSGSAVITYFTVTP